MTDNDPLIIVDIDHQLERPQAKDQELLDRRYAAICRLDTFLSELPLTDIEAGIVAEFWSAYFPHFLPMSGNIDTQKIKPF